MADFRYKAFISYSHNDEAWAKWLHRALEFYHVPKKLVGSPTSIGEAPSRIKPVFRDREDLSSASDLSESIKQILAESENLIVICSPDSAASHWVGEEIREFARQGRKSRIFCLIVAGQPDSTKTGEKCFSQVLSEIGLLEPLAADVRSWADGKRLALLKLISGMLGIRLDDLRQRDQVRRRRLMMITSIGILAAMTLVVMTIISQVSSQHEREKAEQMASVFVEIGERLQTDTDLETLAWINAEASKHFQNLNPEQLSPESGKKVALVLRQVARVSQGQGRPEEALEAYIDSRDILTAVWNKHPEDSGVLYELGISQYHTANLYIKQGEYANAQIELEKNLVATQLLLELDPENPDWIMEHGYAHSNLAAMQLDSGISADEKIVEQLTEAARLMKKAIQIQPFDETKLSGYANTLAYAADAQAGVCNLEEAMSIRETVRELAEEALKSDPGNNALKRRHAFAINGVAMRQIELGRLDAAEQNVEKVISIFQQMSAADPSNVFYRVLVLYERSLLAELIAGNERLIEARTLMQELESEFNLYDESWQKDKEAITNHISFLIAYADVENRLSNKEAARIHLKRAIKLQRELSAGRTLDRRDQRRLLIARFIWWEIHGEDTWDEMPLILGTKPIPAGQTQSCTEVDIAARMYVMEGDVSSAIEQVEYLRARKYADPGFVRFCKNYGLCS